MYGTIKQPPLKLLDGMIYWAPSLKHRAFEVVPRLKQDQYEEVLKFLDQKAAEKKKNKENTDKSSAPKPPKQQDLEDTKKKAAFRPAA